MDRLLEVCDQLAKPNGDFIKIREILEYCYGGDVGKLSYAKDYERLKQKLNRINFAIEFKNGKDLKAGFRYKKEFENYFKHDEEKKIIKKKEGDEQRLFLTGGLQMLFEGETASTHLVELECVSELKNLFLVKVLAKYLGKRVISFQYQQGYENLQAITMHPHLLKEYNSRWFLFGYVKEDDNSLSVVNFALDRIVYQKTGDIRVMNGERYLTVPEDFYRQYFKDIVGVTRPKDGKVETFTIKTIDFKVHHLLRTKPLHYSQQETVPFDNEKQKGEFIIQVIPNIELQTRLLSYGPGLYLAGNGQFQQQLRNAVNKMNQLYCM